MDKKMKNDLIKIRNFKVVGPKKASFIEEIAQLYEQRKIEKLKTAEAICIKLISSGKGPASGIKEIEKYRGHTSTLTKFTENKAENEKEKHLPPMIQWYIKGNVKTESTYRDKKKVGNIKTIYYDDFNQARTITARTEEDAIAIFKNQMNEEFTLDSEATDNSENHKSRVVKGVKASASVFKSEGKGFTISKSLMRSSNAVEYDFIPADRSLDIGDGFCVIDQFVGVYSKYIKSLTVEHFIDLCYLVRGEMPPTKTNILKANIDLNISEDEEYYNPITDKWETEINYNSQIWSIEHGVTPDMLNKILCIMLQISHYAFDITKNCFLKSISPNRNYPALIYITVLITICIMLLIQNLH